MEASSELLTKIDNIKENQAVRLKPNLILWKEGSSYDHDVTNKQFNDLERILENQIGEVFYIIDLSLAKRPTPEMVQLVEERLNPISNKFKHTAVYTGNNYIMLLGIKFYFIRFNFPSYSGHSNYKSALTSLK
mgnify:CR=1 FL=1